MSIYQSHTLKNGLRIVHLPLDSHVSYCGFIVNAGTRDEQPQEFGMAHFVEHMLFKGTQKRRSHHIINRMEAVGGEINAYTNKEETVIYSICLQEHFERAFELLTDLTFHSIFPQHEIEKEIEVILDEINSYEDSPSELIYDEFENQVFRSSQLGHNILGEPHLLTTFDSKMTHRFTGRHYRPDNIVFFSTGKTDFKKIIKLSEKYLSDIVSSIPNQKRLVPSKSNPEHIISNKDTSQSHVLIGGQCYNMHHPKRNTLHLLNNILGGTGMNSRLNISLREKRGYVYNVESSTTLYTDTGLFAIYFGCDKRNTQKCMQLIQKELNLLKNKNLTTLQLSAAKKQLKGQIAISSDNHENLALALGKSYMNYNRLNSMEETVEKIDRITSSDILEVANEIFSEQNISSLSYL